MPDKVIEVPEFDCEEDRHCWGRIDYVYVRRRFLWWKWAKRGEKVKCNMCGEIEYWRVPEYLNV